MLITNSFLPAMIEYKEKCEKAKKRKRKNPPVTNIYR